MHTLLFILSMMMPAQGPVIVVGGSGGSGWSGGVASGTVDLNGNRLTCDADGDTYLLTSTDDELHWYLNNALDITFKANLLELENGTVLQCDSATTVNLCTDGSMVLANQAGTQSTTLTTNASGLAIADAVTATGTITGASSVTASGAGDTSLVVFADNDNNNVSATANVLFQHNAGGTTVAQFTMDEQIAEFPIHVLKSSTETTPMFGVRTLGTGDAAISYILHGANSYATGIDNSASGDPWVLSYNAAGAPVLGTSNLLTVTSTGDLSVSSNVYVANNSGDAGNLMRVDGNADTLYLVASSTGAVATSIGFAPATAGEGANPSAKATLASTGTLTLTGDLAVNGDNITSDSTLTLHSTGNFVFTDDTSSTTLTPTINGLTIDDDITIQIAGALQSQMLSTDNASAFIVGADQGGTGAHVAQFIAQSYDTGDALIALAAGNIATSVAMGIDNSDSGDPLEWNFASSAYPELDSSPEMQLTSAGDLSTAGDVTVGGGGLISSGANDAPAILFIGGDADGATGGDSEGGQLVLGYSGNGTGTGEEANTWNIDVSSIASGSLFRLFANGGANAIIAEPVSGDVTFVGDIAVNGGTITSDADLTITPAGNDVIVTDYLSVNDTPTAGETLKVTHDETNGGAGVAIRGFGFGKGWALAMTPDDATDMQYVRFDNSIGTPIGSIGTVDSQSDLAISSAADLELAGTVIRLVGAVTSSGALDVASTIEGNLATGVSANALCYSGTIGTDNGIGSCTSAKRFKENVQALSISELDKLWRMRPVSFEVKSDPSNRKRYGVIAEELNEIAPEMVFRDTQGQISGVNDLDFKGFFIAGAQWLKGQVDALWESHNEQDVLIAALQAQNVALESRIIALEKKVK